MAIQDTRTQDIRIEPAKLKGIASRKRLLQIGGGVAVIAAISWVTVAWLTGGRSVSADRLRVATVTQGDLVRDIAADGRVTAANSPSLYAEAGGIVTLHVVAGDAVTTGQLLAEIDSPELRSRLAQEQSTLASLDAEVGRAALDAALVRSAALKSLDQARVDQIAAQRQLQRYTRGWEGGAVARVDVDKAADDVSKSRIGVSHAMQDVSLQSSSAAMDARNRRAIADRQRAVVGELHRQVEALRLRAPFDGQVGQILVTQQQNVLANAAVLSVVDLRNLEVEIKVPESQARNLSIGMPAKLSSQGGDVGGTISAIAPEVVNGEVNVRVRFDHGAQPKDLRQNQRLNARVLLGTRRNVLKVERGPSLDSGSTAAWVIRDGVAMQVPVEMGLGGTDSVEIVRGLMKGDRVITSGADDFKPGEKIRIR